MKSPTSFGAFVRAARLGYRWCEALKGWLRVSDAPTGPGNSVRWRIDLAERAECMTQGKVKTYREWWEDDETGEKTIAVSTALQRIAREGFTGSHSFLVDDEGDEVQR